MKKKIYTRFIAVLVTDQVYEHVKMVTDKLEISVTKFVRDLIERELRSMQDSGLMQTIDDTGNDQKYGSKTN